MSISSKYGDMIEYALKGYNYKKLHDKFEDV